jgi:hypothetical protein
LIIVTPIHPSGFACLARSWVAIAMIGPDKQKPTVVLQAMRSHFLLLF